MTDRLTTESGIFWVQEDPGGAMTYVKEIEVPAIPRPRGSMERSHYFDPTVGRYVVTHRRRSEPDAPTLSIVQNLPLTRSILERIFDSDCPRDCFAMWYNCPPRTVFGGYDRGVILSQAQVSGSEEWGPHSAREGTEDATYTLPLDMLEVIPIYALDSTRLTTTETEDIADIAALGLERCGGACGSELEACDVLYMACHSDGVGGTANVLYSTDRAQTIAACSGQPFAADEDISSVVVFPMGPDTWRIIVARGTTDALSPAEIAYADASLSDADVATWTAVNVGSTNGEFVPHSGGLFAADRYHIWCVTDQGNIYFSDDAGATWTEQSVTNTDPLNMIKFIEGGEVGVCVGGTDTTSAVAFYTTDAGEHWTAIDVSGIGAYALYSCDLRDSQRMIFGSEEGTVWVTFDQGLTLTEKSLATPSGWTAWDVVTDLWFAADSVIWASHRFQKSGPAYYGGIQRSVNGGNDWEDFQSVELDADALGINAIVACGVHGAIGVGTPETTGMVLEVYTP